ncbi:serine/threonine-protein kinase [Aeromicrobium endophyticum]|uniref:non-specific serine/threonine protein kinase n=1 Tax=Aeromicrobium endophyticum TaxID=2292704 RepID=A0A371P3M4_9ACTN|nr:serine/threonine-protein kinase [Aeromicrobium endophyticum]REK70178.1 serine/threonine protein kinase [Aeromicrobium endophyticum]
MLAGRYELDHEIGRGGMGSVWLGHDTVLGRDVAVKQIGMTTGGTAPDLERAEREAHLAARINHQNVVAVYDLVDEDGFQWLVMEHVDGPTLAGLIAERGWIEAADLAPIAEQVARALAAAHAHGIVHRDVKPSNILLTSGGVAKLSDFGVARAQADASLTQTGLVTGSPAYLSPEVASGRTATSASDVWSLGASLFHALSGHPPYSVGDNVLGALYRIVNEEPPRLDDGPMTALVTSMMQHDPDARPSMAAVEHTAASLPRGPVAPPIDLEATQGFAAFGETQPVPEAPTVAAPPSATTAFRPLAPPIPEREPEPDPQAAPLVASHAGDTPRRSRMIWVAVGAVAALIAVVVGLRLGGGDDDQPVADSPSSSAPAPTSAPTTDAPAEDATTQALKGFVADYLTTAPNDPDAGFAMLTPDFQKQSKGIKGYKGFWGRVSNLDVQQVSADPASLRVSYTYSYDLDGDSRSDAVTLQLEKSGDSFLIAGEV